MAKTIKTCSMESQLEENGVVLDCKWAFNPVGVYKPQRQKIKQLLLDMDGMEACNRFKWLISSPTIPKERIEQMLYFRSALVFFKQGKEFRLLPFVATGSLNLYGIMDKVQPIAYNGGLDNKSQRKNIGAEIYINQEDEKDTTKGIILYDRQNGYVSTSGTIPTMVLQEYVINEMANRFSFLNINLVNSQGKNIILVKDPKQKASVERTLNSLYASDKAYALVKSMFDVQVINNSIDYEEQSIWEDITSWNNLRREHLGINNQGLFNKKERQLQIQNMQTQDGTETISDGYYESRKKFVEDVKRVFGDDPDFKEQFKQFDVVDLRIEKQPKKETNAEDMESDDNDNVMF